jgi:hypothetical protein
MLVVHEKMLPTKMIVNKAFITSLNDSVPYFFIKDQEIALENGERRG